MEHKIAWYWGGQVFLRSRVQGHCDFHLFEDGVSRSCVFEELEGRASISS